jgi:osmotically-inducible protein OsmY
MQINRWLRCPARLASVALAGVLILSVPSFGQDQAAPDNTGNNKQQTTTADRQSSSKTDREMTAKIRRSLIADKTLSMYAHNIKIITVNGAVTLKGPVKSDDEKQQIASKAAEVAGGPDKVDNQLTVTPQS